MSRRPDELQYPGIRRARIARQLLAHDDEQPLARKDLKPPLELLRVPATGEIRVVPPRMAEVAGLTGDPLLLPARALLLGLQRLLERERLAAECDLVVVVRERAVDRVTEERDQLRGRDGGGDPVRRQRVEQVPRACLAYDLAAASEWEVAAV